MASVEEKAAPTSVVAETRQSADEDDEEMCRISALRQQQQLDAPEQSEIRWGLINSPDPSQRVAGERTRRKLQFFFMNPIDKWRARRRPPYKLSVQLIKVILVTVQVCMFASRRYSHVTYVSESLVAFKHLLLLGWEPTREVSTYPPSVGPFAIYTQQRYFDTLDYAVNSYYNLSRLAVCSVGFPAGTGGISQLCLREYRHVHVDPEHHSFSLDTQQESRCLLLNPTAAERSAHNFSTASYAAVNNFSLPFAGVTRTELSFALNAIKLKLAMPLDVPDCYRFNISVVLDNSQQDGQILVDMLLDAEALACDSDAEFLDDSGEIAVLFTAVNVIVMLLCVASLAMCIRSIYRGQMLRLETSAVLKRYFDYTLSDDENMRFLNLWYVLIIINDVLIVLGSVIQVGLENRTLSYPVGADTWDVCSLFLGVGNLLAWIGVLRYFGFFRSYNALIVTVKRAMPNVLRFSVCATFCYGGFVFCGWLVFSAYSMKFRTLSSTSETLFSLMNGDDMYATFAQVSYKSPLVYWFSKVYVYVFVFFFIYVVLSLMISIIMDSFETIKIYYRDGFPTTPLDEFVAARRLDPSSGVYREPQDERLFIRLLTAFCECSWWTRRSDGLPVSAAHMATVSERAPLLRRGSAVAT